MDTIFQIWVYIIFVKKKKKDHGFGRVQRDWLYDRIENYCLFIWKITVYNDEGIKAENNKEVQ